MYKKIKLYTKNVDNFTKNKALFQDFFYLDTKSQYVKNVGKLSTIQKKLFFLKDLSKKII